MSRKNSVSGEDKPLPAFLQKLYEIVNTAPRSLVSWSSRGEAFVVRDPKLFSNEVLSKYFKSSNFASFVRQLHFYGFHKTDKDKNLWEFRHEHFQPGRVDLLSLIKRKTSATGEESGGKREIEGLKQEVNELRHELVSVRASLSKVMSVLTTLVNQDVKSLPVSKKRKLMATACENEGLDWLNGNGGLGMVAPAAIQQPRTPRLGRTSSAEMWKQSFQQRDGFMEDVLTDLTDLDSTPRPPSQNRSGFTLQELDQSLADAIVGLEPSTPVEQSKDQLMPGITFDSGSFSDLSFVGQPFTPGSNILKDDKSAFSKPFISSLASPPLSVQPSCPPSIPFNNAMNHSGNLASVAAPKPLPDWAALRQLSQQLPADLKAQLTSNLLPELAEELFPGEVTGSNPGIGNSVASAAAVAAAPNTSQKALPPAAVIAAIATVFSSGQMLASGSGQISATPTASQQLVRSSSFQNNAFGSGTSVTPQQIQNLFVSLLMPQVQLALISQLRKKNSQQTSSLY